MSPKTKKNEGKQERRKGQPLITVQDIRAAQNGDGSAWKRIRRYFMPRIRVMVYQYRPGYTAQDYRDRQNSAEAALLEALMNFEIRC